MSLSVKEVRCDFGVCGESALAVIQTDLKRRGLSLSVSVEEAWPVCPSVSVKERRKVEKCGFTVET